MEKFLLLFVVSIISYLFGSIPNAVLIGEIFFHKDVREYGSKNAGGTNAGRVLGKKVGFIVIILDIIKTIVPMYLSYFILKYTSLNQFNIEDYAYILSAFFALVGHCYPIFAKFKGGKAVSSFAAISLATSWLLSLIGCFIFFLILKLKKYVSLSSILGSFSVVLTLLILLIIKSNLGLYFVNNSIYLFILFLISWLILTFRHRSNIKRLINHTESKIKWMK